MKAKYILVRETASTNTYLSGVKNVLPNGSVVYTTNQTAGRGQRGNSWESEPGKNITFSLLLKGLTLPAKEQFYISEAVSLAIVKVLSRYAEGFSIKWPNDIYYYDSKICGILIENTLLGSTISHSVAGVGLNVNQEKFLSDAPNPISLFNILGSETDCETILREIGDRIFSKAQILFGDIDRSKLTELHKGYLENLYRKDDEFYKFRLPDGTEYEAKIIDVAPDGMMTVEYRNGEVKGYYFKEIAFVI